MEWLKKLKILMMTGFKLETLKETVDYTMLKKLLSEKLNRVL